MVSNGSVVRPDEHDLRKEVGHNLITTDTGDRPFVLIQNRFPLSMRYAFSYLSYIWVRVR
ncbi:MAG: hypothetical protein XD84_2190 [Desulfotomaculum sp. 46_80]|nr:MAG: hypothetical protein XD84_2190 [Desulfotomaculum sp. 46_80]